MLAFFGLQGDSSETEESTAEPSADAEAAEASKLLFHCHDMMRVADGARKAQASARACAASNCEKLSQVRAQQLMTPNGTDPVFIIGYAGLSSICIHWEC